MGKEEGLEGKEWGGKEKKREESKEVVGEEKS